MKPPISVLGTGRMGSALARALLQAGYRTTVWNRTKQKAEPLAAVGATVAASALEAVDAAQFIIVNVSDYSATAALLHSDAVASAIRGKLVVELTSGTPDACRRRIGRRPHQADGRRTFRQRRTRRSRRSPHTTAHCSISWS